MDIQGSAIKLGEVVMKHVAKVWMDARSAELDRNSTLSDLIAVSVRDRFVRSDLERQLGRLGNDSARRLVRLAEVEFRKVPENELIAATDAASDTLSAIDISDSALFSVDMSHVAFARKVRELIPHQARKAGLSEAGTAYYWRIIDESSVTIISLIRRLPEFDSRALVEVLHRLTLLQDAVERIPQVVIDQTGENYDDDQFRVEYLEHVSETMDELELFGIDTQQYRPRTLVSVAYISLTLNVNPRQITKNRRKLEQHVGRLSSLSIAAQGGNATQAEHILASNRRILLRGEAGSGKTTLLQWIAVNCARGRFQGALADWNGRTPFYIRLRSFAENGLPSPADFISFAAPLLDEFTPRQWTHRQLKHGNALLLIDGVDELVATQRRVVRRWLSDLTKKYPEVPVIVTSRPAAATSDWLSEQGFRGVMLDPMTERDIVNFCRRWHEAVIDAASKGYANLPISIAELGQYESTLLQTLDSRTDLRRLVANPLLCALICALNLARRTQLPRNRIALYRAAIQLLVERRDIERTIPASEALQLDADTKVAILQRLAWRLTLAGRAEMTRDQATDHVERVLSTMPYISADPSDVLQHLLERSGLIREPAVGRIDFIHRTFQEFLSGKEIAEDHWTEKLIENAHKDQWRETVIMAAGHAAMPIRREILSKILDRAVAEPKRARSLRLVAAACSDACRQIDSDVTARIESELSKLLPPRDIREARSLVQAGGAVIGGLPRTLSSSSVSEARACVATAGLTGGDEALRLLAAYAEDPRSEVQSQILDCWRYFEPTLYSATVLAGAKGGANITVDTLEKARLAQGFPYVQRITLRPSQQIQGFDATGLDKLHDLHIRDSAPPDYQLDIASLVDNCPNLASLHAHVPTDQRSLQRLGGLESLSVLDLRFSGQLRSLNFLDRINADLRELWLMSASGSVSNFSPIARFKRLRDLTLFNAKHFTWDVLRGLNDLTDLYIYDAELKYGFQGAHGSITPRLNHLMVGPTSAQLRPADLAFVTSLRNLWFLNSHSVDFSGVERCSSVRSLLLTEAAVPQDFAPIAKMSELKHLQIEKRTPGRVDLSPFATSEQKLTITTTGGAWVHESDPVWGNTNIFVYHQ